MEQVQIAAQALVELSWWVQRKGTMRAGLETLPGTERVIIGYLENEPGTSVTEMGSALDIKSSNVSAAVSGLVERGLVEKKPDPDDKRRSLLFLTSLARENKSSIDAAITGSLEEVLEQLSAEHRDSLFASLEALSEIALRLRPPG